MWHCVILLSSGNVFYFRLFFCLFIKTNARENWKYNHFFPLFCWKKKWKKKLGNKIGQWFFFRLPIWISKMKEKLKQVGTFGCNFFNKSLQSKWNLPICSVYIKKNTLRKKNRDREQLIQMFLTARMCSLSDSIKKNAWEILSLLYKQIKTKRCQNIYLTDEFECYEKTWRRHGRKYELKAKQPLKLIMAENWVREFNWRVFWIRLKATNFNEDNHTNLGKYSIWICLVVENEKKRSRPNFAALQCAHLMCMEKVNRGRFFSCIFFSYLLAPSPRNETSWYHDVLCITLNVSLLFILSLLKLAILCIVYLRSTGCYVARIFFFLEKYTKFFHSYFFFALDFQTYFHF